MKKKIFLCLCLFFCSRAFAQGNFPQLKGEHFIISYAQDQEDFAAKVLKNAEIYYDSVARELGYARHSNFWKWDKRVQIVIHPDHQSFLKATRAAAWSHGIADYQNKVIVSYVWGKDFIEVLLPHEITHLVFRDFIGFRGEVPLWLDEGVAQWQEKSLRRTRFENLKQLAELELLIPLDQMMRVDIGSLTKNEEVAFVLPGPGEQKTVKLKSHEFVSIYYLQAFSLVGLLIEKYGTDNFVVFCRQLRDGKDVENALRHTYPTQLRSFGDLDKIWHKYLENI